MEYVGLENSFLDRIHLNYQGDKEQRVAIARSLCMEPGTFLVADEPIASLDVSIQAPDRQSVPSSAGGAWDLHFCFIAP